MTKPAIVVLDRNLRTHDNPCLFEAAKSKKPIIVAYLYDEKFSRPLGSSHKWWLHHSLTELQKKLPLVLCKGELNPLIEKSGADMLYWNRPIDPGARSKFQAITKSAPHLTVKECTPDLLIKPEELLTDTGGYYKVFTPFWKKCLKHINETNENSLPKIHFVSEIKGDSLESWKLLDGLICENLDQYWEPGEEGAKKRLEEFIPKIEEYRGKRDIMSCEGTSKLSPHLHWGEISIREVFNKTQGSETYISELGWREFSYYLLHHFPDLPKKNFNPKFNQFKWDNSKEHFEAWKMGQTGYSMVDAAMRELLEMGWMHNRSRMIVGSFLVKDLLIDWRQGEEWFWDLLVDGDPAQNAFNWQWIAGSGADAAPFFRIFNPTTQGEKFDPEGIYRSKYIPEYNGAFDYLLPIVDHKKMRNEALERYKLCNGSEQ
ncbi:MAG: DNA photolyase family protein [Simkaniaceae bacterium]|nr:DNA photolyase family protein [Simkaniaceae bacterium]